VHLAQELGNLYVPWFFRSIVEVWERYNVLYDPHGISGTSGEEWWRAPPITDGPGEEWLWAIAGLPVLGDWLDSPECDALRQLIEQHKPWESIPPLGDDTPKRGYAKAARPLADAIKAKALSIGSLVSMARTTRHGDTGVLQVVMLLTALMQRVPMFDKVPRFSLYRRLELGQIFLGIFQFPPQGGRRT